MAWFLRWIGIGDDFLAHVEEIRLGVQHPGLFWAGLVALVPLAALIYRRQRHNLSSLAPALLLALSAIRIAILFLLVLVLAGPYLKMDHQDKKKPIVALLFDHSQSMQLPAGEYGKQEEQAPARVARPESAKGVRQEARHSQTQGVPPSTSRLQFTHNAIQASARSFLEPLAKKYDVRAYTFARELTPLALDPAGPEFLDAEATGPSTHLGDVLAQTLQDSAGRSLAGMVVFSDGQSTGGRSLAEAAHQAAEAGVPIFTVPPGSAVRVRDVALVDVFSTEQVSVGDIARVAVTLESQGFDGRTVQVELREGDKLLDSKDLVLRGSEQQHVDLSFEAKLPGAHYLTVQVPPLAEEPPELRSNNTDVTLVRVREEKLRVLYVEGLPRWDFRFLKNAMRRDHGLAGRQSSQPDIVLEAEARRRSPTSTTMLPGRLEELAKYHTVILGDASPELLNARFIELLAQAVRERGVGLIVAAGPLHMPQQFSDHLHELLPVRLRTSGGSELEAPAYRPFRLELSPDGSVHEAMRLYDDPGRNQEVWNRMPAYYWCAATERLAPAAAALAWNPALEGRYGKLPLIAYQFAGKGRVLFVGTDSTWLWRQNVGDRYFDKFWGQSLRFVARREDKFNKSWMEVRPIRAQPGEPARIELMAFTTDGQPRTEEKLAVQAFGPEAAEIIEVTADPGTPGRYTGRIVPPKTGDYRLRFQPEGAPPVEALLKALPGGEELRHPNINRPALALLASTSGGRLVELADLASIPDQLKGDTKLIELHREATLWDNWLMLAVLVVLYSVDVGLRRLTGLS
jgi:hypothetical protein